MKKYNVTALGELLIDFTETSQEIKDLFNDLSNLDSLFLQLQFHFHKRLTTRQSAIIFDEVQECPMARQAIKKLVKVANIIDI